MGISYIIPVYHCLSTLGPCLDSFFAQEGREEDDEVILCFDGAEEDETYALGKQYQEKYGCVKLVYPKIHYGAFRIRLLGIKEAKNDHIGFIDSDDTLPQGALKEVHELLKKEDCDILAFSFYVKKKKGGHKNAFTAKEGNRDNKQAFLGLLQDSYIRGFLWTKVFKKSLLESVPDYGIVGKDTCFEDVFYNAMLFANASNVYYTPKILYNYHQVGMATAVRKPRINRTAYHLACFASIRLFLEKHGKTDLFSYFYKSKTRSYWSMWYDLRCDTKFGLDKDSKKRLKQAFQRIFNPKVPLKKEPLLDQYIDPGLRVN